MRFKQFNEIVETRQKECRDTLIPKGHEYSRNGDRLHNFKSARWLQLPPDTDAAACWNLNTKHTVSVMDMIDDLAVGEYPTPAQIKEKFGDFHNYLYLLEACIIEELEQQIQD